jgi:ankyrin repeat protein
MAHFLLEAGAEVDAPASKVHGRTALEGAAWQGRLDMVAMLLKAGAALKGNDQAQIQRAISFAEENDHFYIAKLLTHYGQTKRLSSIEPSPFEQFSEELFDYRLYELN